MPKTSHLYFCQAVTFLPLRADAAGVCVSCIGTQAILGLIGAGLRPQHGGAAALIGACLHRATWLSLPPSFSSFCSYYHLHRYQTSTISRHAFASSRSLAGYLPQSRLSDSARDPPLTTPAERLVSVKFSARQLAIVC
jgi:hypothetical protein